MKERARIESIAELRRICQDPVRQFNDLTGSLYGWRFSIHVTRLFLSLGLSASFASSLMVITGLAGSLCCLFGGFALTTGLFLLVATYVLDCVDGEMARYYRIDSFRWAAVDYVHHLLTKGLAFPCIGIGLYVTYGNPWTIAAGGIGAAFWLILVGVRDLSLVLFAKKIVANEGRDKNPAFRRLVRNIKQLRLDELEPEEDSKNIWCDDFQFEPWMIRTFFTSFDIVIPLLFFASVVDRFVPSFAVLGFSLSAVSVLILVYALILPVHTADCIHTAMTRGLVRDELYDLAVKAEKYGRHHAESMAEGPSSLPIVAVPEPPADRVA